MLKLQSAKRYTKEDYIHIKELIEGNSYICRPPIIQTELCKNCPTKRACEDILLLYEHIEEILKQSPA